MSDSLPRFKATDPDAYEHFMGRWSARLAEPFLDFAGVQPGHKTLDVGCGAGTTSLALAERGATTVGVDASENYLEGARRGRSHPNATSEYGDACHLDYPTASFVACVSTLAIDVIPEVDLVAAEMRASHTFRAGPSPVPPLTSGEASPCLTSCWIQARSLMRASVHAPAARRRARRTRQRTRNPRPHRSGVPRLPPLRVLPVASMSVGQQGPGPVGWPRSAMPWATSAWLRLASIHRWAGADRWRALTRVLGCVDVAGRLASLPGGSKLVVVPVSAEWSGRRCRWWSAGPVEQLAPGALPGPRGWKVQGHSAGRGRDPGGHGDQLASDGRGGGLGQSRAGDRRGGAGQVERDHGQHEPGGVRGELPRGQMRQGIADTGGRVLRDFVLLRPGTPLGSGRACSRVAN